MAGSKRTNEKKLYRCPECGLHYEERIWAEKCEIWCRENKSCSREITAHAQENKTVISFPVPGSGKG
jgi:hypothetical protein